MPPKPVPKPRLRRSGKTYEVREVIAGKVRTRTLGTQDYNEALRRFPAVYGVMVAEHEKPAPASSAAALAPTKKITLAEACNLYARDLIASEESFRREHGFGREHEAVKLAVEYRQRLQRWLTEAQSRFTIRAFDHQHLFLMRLAVEGHAKRDEETARALARKLFDDYDGALRELARTGIKTIREMIAADEESGIPAPVDPAPATIAPSNAPLLSAVAKTYVASNVRLTDVVKLDVRAVVRDLIEIVGDKPVDRYTRADGRVFRDVLTRLPSNRHKKRELRDLSIRDAIERAEELKLPKIAPKTLLTKRGHIARVFSYAVAEHDGVFNPFESLDSWNIVVESAADQWEPFTDDELRKLLRVKMPEALWWLTRLGLYTGARLGELAQLTGDLVRVDPVPHIYYSPKMRLKRAASVRSAPIHPKLIELGFLDFAKRAGSGRLFPDAKARKLTGRHSHEPSKDFSALLASKKVKLKRPKLSFHSLRHNWTAEWKRTHLLDTETRERLIGHAVGGVSGRYGGSYVAEAADMKLLEARAKLVEALKFDF